jgi:hypothetical protein
MGREPLIASPQYFAYNAQEDARSYVFEPGADMGLGPLGPRPQAWAEKPLPWPSKSARGLLAPDWPSGQVRTCTLASRSPSAPHLLPSWLLVQLFPRSTDPSSHQPELGGALRRHRRPDEAGRLRATAIFLYLPLANQPIRPSRTEGQIVEAGQVNF